MRYPIRIVVPLAAAMLSFVPPARAQVARSATALPPSPVAWTPVATQPIAVSVAANEPFLVALEEESCGFGGLARTVTGGRQFWRFWAIRGTYTMGTCVPNFGSAVPSDLPADVRIEASIALTSTQPAVIYTFRPVGSMSVPGGARDRRRRREAGRARLQPGRHVTRGPHAAAERWPRDPHGGRQSGDRVVGGGLRADPLPVGRCRGASATRPLRDEDRLVATPA